MGRLREMPLECRPAWDWEGQQQDDEDRRKRRSGGIFLIAREISRGGREAGAGSDCTGGCADWDMRALIYPTNDAADKNARE